VLDCSKPKAVIFDLDDTLLGLDGSHNGLWYTACQLYAHQLKGFTSEKLAETIVETRRVIWSNRETRRRGRLSLKDTRNRFITDSLLQLGMDAPDLASKIVQSYETIVNERLYLLPESIPTITRLRDMGISLAMITNGETETQRYKINRFNLMEYFDSILVEGEFGIGKPDESVYLHTLNQLKSKPSETWMVGDDVDCDVAGPQRLGIYGIWFNNKGRVIPEEKNCLPDKIISSLEELFDGLA
jgi:putative hydrolase of the HAD superfamily